ncbi:dihydrodipicolinate synthase family protein [Acidianus infernus]|uniref:Dihydrodipicolinate synthase family protein n=1 Tax=Acidianus infernus TaxID=12915 RepID=A0A6A9QG64_ACIIN|nr:dihydrodipicolinate synthase family protein [Acidianus infernus]MUM64773.1 dihydrodipicolinate synthase family protein [Acidianus infernus]
MKGLLTALVTPFNSSGDLNLDALDTLIKFNLSRGVDGFWVLGTTGEFNMLSIEEKMQVAKKVIDVAKGKVLLGVNENSTYNSLKLAKYFIDLGVNGIFSVPPIYHKPSEKGLIHYYEDLGKFGEEVYVYNIPSLVGYNIPLTVLQKLVEDGIIQGMKYTTSDFESLINYMRFLKNLNSKFEFLAGNDKFILISLLYGVDGIVSGVSNFAPEVVSQLYKNVKEGKITEALKLQEIVDKLVEVTSLADYPSGIKIALRYRGIDVGSSRKPLEENITADSAIYHTLKEFNL